MSIRVLHQTSREAADNDDLQAYVGRARHAPGCEAAEFYRGIEYPENVAISEQWSDLFTYSHFWEALLENSFDADLLCNSTAPRRYGSDGSEMYERTVFARTQTGFEPIEYQGRTPAISFAGNGAIRILVYMSPAHLDENLTRMFVNTKATRRQPGCEHFETFRDAEFPQHTVLIELWTDQITFDDHLLFPRRNYGPARNNEQAPRQQGENSLELYRHQRFVHLFGTWVPDSLERRAERLLWPN